MKGIILAAGRGSRLGHMTEERPKCLVTVLEKPLLHWQAEALQGAGVEEIAVVRGYRREDFTFSEFHYFENQRWAETNMVASLMCADAWLSSDDCIISYADLLYPSGVVQKLQSVQADLAISYDPHWLKLWSERFEDPLCDSETFEVNERGELLEIGKRAAHVSEIRGQYMGLLKFTPTGWERIKQFLHRIGPSAWARMDMTTLLSHLLQQGQTVQTVSIEEEWWFEIDSVHDLELASRKLAKGVPS